MVIHSALGATLRGSIFGTRPASVHHAVPVANCGNAQRAATPLAIVRDAKDFLCGPNKPSSPLQPRRRAMMLDPTRLPFEEADIQVPPRLPSLSVGRSASAGASIGVGGSSASAPPTRGAIERGLLNSPFALPSPPNTDPPRRMRKKKGGLSSSSLGPAMPDSPMPPPPRHTADPEMCAQVPSLNVGLANSLIKPSTCCMSLIDSPKTPTLECNTKDYMDDITNSLGRDDIIRGTEISWVRGELLGRGSLGCVWKALNRSSGQMMAVKEVVFDCFDKDEEKFRTSLQNEVAIYKELEHPHIVSYLGNDYLSGRLFIYLEYMPGGSVAQVLSQFGALDEPLVARYLRGLLEGLTYLHTRTPPVLHRDIKGANILVGLDRNVKLSDFGCSKRSNGTMVQTLRGSVPWMAPEVMRQSNYGRKADIWSIGCVVIEMATASAPWGPFDNHLAAMVRIAMSDETPPVPESLSEPCRDIILQCTRRSPDGRPSASQLLEHEFVQGCPDTLGNDDSWGSGL